MLFSSPEFLFAFLPITLVGFYVAAQFAERRIALIWLVAASLFFYGWWNPALLPLLIVSIAVNFGMGRLLARRRTKLVLGSGVVFDLGLLAYFKYTDFLIGTVNNLAGTSHPLQQIVLPLAISFFTFQQIAYLVDVYQNRTNDPDFLHYCLFVSFFPQLIAGPIVHHSETIPQFRQDAVFRLNRANLVVGLTITVIGLYKKVVLADGIAPYADRVFDTAASAPPAFIAAWSGALAYSFQIYFDFSGYSEMAIGLSLLIGIRLPLNFNSPYKAASIIDFWRRWHMTLSRFLRDYLYIPLGGNRRGSGNRYGNLMVVMLLGGLWHGAAWNFVLWGGLHGFYLVINRAWRGARRRLGHDLARSSRTGRALAVSLTFLCVVIGWVFFRADSWAAASAVLHGMAGLNGGFGEISLGALETNGFVWLGAMLAIVWCAPNFKDLLGDFQPVLNVTPGPSGTRHAAAMALRVYWLAPLVFTMAAVSLVVIILRGGGGQQFIYMIF